MEEQEEIQKSKLKEADYHSISEYENILVLKNITKEKHIIYKYITMDRVSSVVVLLQRVILVFGSKSHTS